MTAPSLTQALSSRAKSKDLVFPGLLHKARIVVYCMLLFRLARPECLTVQPPEPAESPSHIRAAITLGGKPAKGVKVNVYLSGTQQSVFEAQTDENGVVMTPKLTERDYSVVAALDKDVQMSLWVRVVPMHEANTLSIDLTGANYQAHPELGLETYAGTDEQIQNRIAAFEGTVADITGALITDSKIRVLKMGAPYKDFILPLKPDSYGHFAAELPEGRYIAYFFATSFRTVRIPFQVTKDGKDVLKIAMEPGRC